MEGNFPKRARKLVEAWIELRKAKLQDNWNLLNIDPGNPRFFKIEPLK